MTRRRVAGTSGAEVEPRWKGETGVAGPADRWKRRRGSSDG